MLRKFVLEKDWNVAMQLGFKRYGNLVCTQTKEDFSSYFSYWRDYKSLRGFINDEESAVCIYTNLYDIINDNPIDKEFRAFGKERDYLYPPDLKKDLYVLMLVHPDKNKGYIFANDYDNSDIIYLNGLLNLLIKTRNDSDVNIYCNIASKEVEIHNHATLDHGFKRLDLSFVYPDKKTQGFTYVYCEENSRIIWKPKPKEEWEYSGGGILI